MEDEEQGRADQAVLDDLVKEVPLTQSPASEPISVSGVSIPQFSIATPETSLVQSAPVSAIDFKMNEERIPISAVQTNVPDQSMAQTSFGGFKFTGGDFSRFSSPKYDMGTTPSSSYPGLDGHPRRITPIPVSQNQSPVQVMEKTPEEIQKGASDLIQRLENEKKAREDLAR